MIRFICIILFFQFICITAKASSCYLMPDLNNPEILKIEKRSQRTKDTICKVDCSESDAEVYKVQVEKRDLDLIDRGKKLIGLNANKDWEKGMEIAKDEVIVCSVDEDKKQAKADAKAAKEAEERAKKDKRKSDWDGLCANPKAGLEAILCEERGY